ncbi:MAG: hypothetical protein EOP83_07930 [Verrucomicrobiaceae bacterium]|nr:MAG: hypothetical protein EOP83_07930 [Verrucomicrobiaceae bacterium]
MSLLEEPEQLDELQGIKRHGTDKDFTGRNQVVMYLQSKGFDVLGYGEYGAVCDHPSFNGKYVLKVFRDKNFEVFIDYCKANAGNRYLPKFHGKLIRLGEAAAMIRVEKLNPVSDDFYYQALGQLVVMVHRYTHPSANDEMRQQALDWVEDMSYEEFFETLVTLTQNAPAGAEMDLHPGNFMRRGPRGGVVISDPYKGAELPFGKMPNQGGRL